jgi:putative membrane protein
MLNLLIAWLVASVAVWVTAKVLPGFSVEGFKGAVVGSAVLGLLQVVIGWLLYFLIGVGTLGLGFLLGFITRCVVTALLLILVDRATSAIKVKSFGTAFIGAVCISVITEVISLILN